MLNLLALNVNSAMIPRYRRLVPLCLRSRKICIFVDDKIHLPTKAPEEPPRGHPGGAAAGGYV